VLNILRVPEDSRSIVLHPVPNHPTPFKLRKPMYCRLTLEYHYDSDGNQLPGRCSRICEHGVMAATYSFEVQFPMLIKGGLNA
tara:strand:+ start:1251 stop:1499 length:249 start_codon:yes stop_codon:yes gene_type:complete